MWSEGRSGIGGLVARGGSAGLSPRGQRQATRGLKPPRYVTYVAETGRFMRSTFPFAPTFAAFRRRRLRRMRWKVTISARGMKMTSAMRRANRRMMILPSRGKATPAVRTPTIRNSHSMGFVELSFRWIRIQ
jgi:hypothetical protein